MTEVEKDTQRPAYQSPVLSGPARFLIMAAAFVIVIAGMRAAVEIIIPFLLAIFLAIISLTIMLAGLMIGTILATSIADFTTDLPRYTTELNANVQRLEERWETWLDEQRERFALDDKDKVVLDNGTVRFPRPRRQWWTRKPKSKNPFR
jgi:predicted PurR-regulated permease PerM